MKIIVHNYGKLRVDNQNKEDSMGFLEQTKTGKNGQNAEMVKINKRWIYLKKIVYEIHNEIGYLRKIAKLCK